MRAAITNDRPPFTAIVSGWLGQRQANVRLTESFEEMIEATAADRFRLAVLWSDDGYKAISAIRRIRDASIDNLIMVMMPPQASDGQHRAMALRAGADEAQTWPIGEDEFVERCRALLRRERTSADDEGIIRFVSCEFVPERQIIRSNGSTISLTKTETAYLAAISRHTDKVVTDTAIVNEVYGINHPPVSRNLVKVHVCKLRRRLYALTGGLDVIESVWGRGYRFVPEGYAPTFNHKGQRIAG